MAVQETGHDSPIRIDRRREGGWRLSCSQWLPGPPDAVFPFFGNARNLERITPPFLRFRIRRVRGEPLEAGSRIDYSLRLHRLPVRWRTLIEIWDPPHRFVDLQIRGPFRRWRHRHTFEEHAGRTLVTDVVDFDLYCRPLARTPLLAWIDTDLRAIFAYRRHATAGVFDGSPGICAAGERHGRLTMPAPVARPTIVACGSACRPTEPLQESAPFFGADS